jgi:DNA-binding protein HU-beta
LRRHGVSGIFPRIVWGGRSASGKGRQNVATVNKSTLIERIADEANASKSEAQKFFDAFTGVVESELKKGNQVQITGFGKFYVQRRDARQGINPQTKQRINIPASKVPKFTAGNALKDQIK